MAEKNEQPQVDEKLKNAQPLGQKLGGKKQMQVKMKLNVRNILLWLIVLFFGIPLVISLIQPKSNDKEISLSGALRDIKSGQVKEIEVDGEKMFLKYGDGHEEITRKEAEVGLTEVLKDAGIDVAGTDLKIRDASMSKVWSEILLSLLPILGMGFLLLFLFRQARGQQDSLFSFGQSKAKVFSKGKQDVRFADVAGVDEAKRELEELVDFLKNPAKYRAVGARTPKGVLLFGPSGVGKTLLAKAIAGEAGVPFFSMAGSEFMEMLVGIGASRVRDLFATAKRSAPAIIFIDEIDAIGRQRGSGFTSGGHDEREQTLNQILVEMDGFTPNDNVIVVAATNRGDLLDPALLRPGRFDRRVMLDYPDVDGRKAILKIHARGKPFATGVDWDKVARRTVGFSGADLENMLNEAAILAARDGKKVIDMVDLEEAATKVKLGPEKKRLQSDLEKKMTAYHEAGHAIVGFYMPQLDPVHRVSIVSRGMALGFTMMQPLTDRYQETKTRLMETISMMLGGRAAEELVFGELTGGAANDLDKATRVARNMVVSYGMSELGPGYWGPQSEVSEMGKTNWYEPAQLSNEMQSKVDKEIKKIIDEAYKMTVKTTLIGITKNRNEIIGEGNFDNYHNRRDPIVSVKFADIVKPHPYAEERIKAVKIVTIGPGSIAGSLDPALKPFGHLLTREKKVVFVGNFFGHPGEKFHGFKDLQKWFGPLIPGRDPFIDVLIASQMTRKQFETEYPLIAARYGKAKWIGDYPDAPDRQRNGDRRITVMRREHLHRVDEKQAMRHNSEELAQALQELVRENFYLYSRVPVLAENGYGAQAY